MYRFRDCLQTLNYRKFWENGSCCLKYAFIDLEQSSQELNSGL